MSKRTPKKKSAEDKVQKNENTEYIDPLQSSYTRRPIDRMVKQNMIQPSNHNSPPTKTMKEKEINVYNSKPQSTFEFSKPTRLYPFDELKASSNEQEYVELNENGHEYYDDKNDELLNEKKKEGSVIHPSGKATSTVKHRVVPHSPITEKCPDVSSSTTPKNPKPLKKTTPSNSNSGYTVLYYAMGVLASVIIIVLGAVYYYTNALNSFQISNSLFSNSPKASQSLPQIDVATIMDDLKRDFNNQPAMTFKIVKSAIHTLNKINPKEPAIIALHAEQGAEDISRRFARQLTESVSQYSDVVTILGREFSEQDPDTAKKAIDDLLNRSLKENTIGAVFVDRLDYVPGDAALIFHTYCDHENAPFKRVLYVMTVGSDQTQLALAEPKEWDTKLQEHLYKSWSVLGVDQISALMSRLTVRVAAIVSKDVL